MDHWWRRWTPVAPPLSRARVTQGAKPLFCIIAKFAVVVARNGKLFGQTSSFSLSFHPGFNLQHQLPFLVVMLPTTTTTTTTTTIAGVKRTSDDVEGPLEEPNGKYNNRRFYSIKLSSTSSQQPQTVRTGTGESWRLRGVQVILATVWARVLNHSVAVPPTTTTKTAFTRPTKMATTKAKATTAAGAKATSEAKCRPLAALFPFARPP